MHSYHNLAQWGDYFLILIEYPEAEGRKLCFIFCFHSSAHSQLTHQSLEQMNENQQQTAAVKLPHNK